jgi:hypothetical protein
MMMGDGSDKRPRHQNNMHNNNNAQFCPNPIAVPFATRRNFGLRSAERCKNSKNDSRRPPKKIKMEENIIPKTGPRQILVNDDFASAPPARMHPFS